MWNSIRKIGAVLTLTVVVLAGCSNGTVGARETFTVGMECGYAPFNWTESNGDNGGVEIAASQFCSGYDVEIAKLIAEELDRELVIQKTTWEGLILAAQSDQIDAIIAGMLPTEERRKEIDFTDNYTKGEYGIVVRKDGPYVGGTTVQDFKDMVVGAQMGTYHIELLAQLVAAKPMPPMKDFTTMTVATKSGEIDGFVADSSSGLAVTAANPDLVYLDLMGEGGYEIMADYRGSSIGMKKGNPLKADVNAALATISEEERAVLMEKALAASA